MPRSTSAPSPVSVSHRLTQWFASHARDLPWRHSRDPYAILVSEMMLQQTQVKTVLPYFQRWMRRFPDLETLAAAEDQEVLSLWQGLGYYSRAKNLHQSARTIIAQHGGAMPTDASTLRQLPGWGEYTVGAVLSFAFDQRIAAIDANVTRVLSRLFNVQISVDTAAGRQHIRALADGLLPVTGSRLHNAAIMELGALVCLPKPRCPDCPVRSACQATDPASLPVKKARAEVTTRIERVVLVEKNNSILLEQRTVQPWKDLWVLPPLHRPPAPLEQPVVTHPFSITRYRVILEVYPSQESIHHSRSRWFTWPELALLPVPAPHRRVLEAVGSTAISRTAPPSMDDF